MCTTNFSSTPGLARRSPPQRKGLPIVPALWGGLWGGGVGDGQLVVNPERLHRYESIAVGPNRLVDPSRIGQRSWGRPNRFRMNSCCPLSNPSKAQAGERGGRMQPHEPEEQSLPRTSTELDTAWTARHRLLFLEATRRTRGPIGHENAH